MKAFRFESLPLLFGTLICVLALVISISWSHVKDLYRRNRTHL